MYLSSSSPTPPSVFHPAIRPPRVDGRRRRRTCRFAGAPSVIDSSRAVVSLFSEGRSLVLPSGVGRVREWKCFRRSERDASIDRGREAATCKGCWRRRVCLDNELGMRVTSAELQVSSDSRFPSGCPRPGGAVSERCMADAWRSRCNPVECVDRYRLEHAPHVPLSGRRINSIWITGKLQPGMKM